MTAGVREAIATDSETGTRAAQTMARLLDRDRQFPITPCDIYNERQRAVRDRLEGRSRIEHLLHLLNGDDYIVAHKLDSSRRVTHMFFALCEAVEVFKQNPDVVLMDCTYRTNTFNMPLLNMVGVTGMNTTIHLAQAFLRGEEQGDYEWALLQLKSLLHARDIEHPQVIFVDRDLALLNALERVFPRTPVLLCLWYIVKDVETHARHHGFPQVVDQEKSTSRTPKWKDSDDHRAFCNTFIALTRAPMEEVYELRRSYLHQMHHGEAIYIDEVWLDIWKRRIVRCWTNSVLHFGQQATSRVEGYHAALKLWLRTSRGDMLILLSRMVHWWRQSIGKHHTAVSNERIKLPNSLSTPLLLASSKLSTSML